RRPGTAVSPDRLPRQRRGRLAVGSPAERAMGSSRGPRGGPRRHRIRLALPPPPDRRRPLLRGNGMTIGVAIVGCGLIGAKRAASLDGVARLVALYDVDDRRSAALARASSVAPVVEPDLDR